MAVERVDMGGYTLIENAPLLKRNTLRVDARAKLLAEVRDASKLPELLEFPALRAGRHGRHATLQPHDISPKFARSKQRAPGPRIEAP